MYPGQPQTSQYDNNRTTKKCLGGSETSKFAKRLDVVKKTIFRSFKKFLSTKFRAHYNFIARVRRKHFNPSFTVFAEAKKFIIENFNIMNPEKYAIILVALIDSKKKFVHEDPFFAEIRFQVLDLLKYFNLEKLDRMLAIKEFSFFLAYFLNEDFSVISRNKVEEDLKTVYFRQIMWLKAKVTSV